MFFRRARGTISERRETGLLKPKMVKPRRAIIPTGYKLHKDYADNELIVCISCGQSGRDRKSVRHKKNCRNPAARGSGEAAPQPSSKREARRNEKYKNSKMIGRKGM